MCVAVLADGTLRWYRLASGGEVLSLAISHDRKLWAAWTPDNRWDASIHGNDLLCMCVNHGSMHAAECRHLDRFGRDGYDPLAIARLFEEDDSSASFRPTALILSPVNGFVSSDSTGCPPHQDLLAAQRSGHRAIPCCQRNPATGRCPWYFGCFQEPGPDDGFPVELHLGANTISIVACNRWGCGDTATIPVQRRPFLSMQQACDGVTGSSCCRWGYPDISALLRP